MKTIYLDDEWGDTLEVEAFQEFVSLNLLKQSNHPAYDFALTVEDAKTLRKYLKKAIKLMEQESA